MMPLFLFQNTLILRRLIHHQIATAFKKTTIKDSKEV